MASAKAQETRRRILEATTAIILQQGFTQLTLDEVAKQANVSKGGLLYHFASKEALLMGVIEAQEARQFELYEQHQLTMGPMEAFVTLQIQQQEEFHLDMDALLYLLSLLKDHATFVEERKRQVEHFFRQLTEQMDPVEVLSIRFTLDGLKLSEHFQFGAPSPTIRQQLIQQLIERARQLDKQIEE
ncbi:TetR/AcrR family transcriptional regulator [Exiguobacterium acetylicum]|uniref:TetR/AcrR family transcriptional regulator n=1 Tax=Exiguobacterium TaxID=33986 RepID=UPI000E7E0493|nr:MULTISPECIES: TetR/AcrR family transcriptional regulator [Exiguobacterium]MDQ6468400.1 TetR/AcrR family transcriptional regulator [Exiguobacterium acetylicum]HAB34680.1 TetR/AcrR family transcriptional regulator [Exiguobacterium sp.]HAZ40179.1 TetR/AcrR family transcriptional regulator [Exiguobacterium sp.]